MVIDLLLAEVFVFLGFPGGQVSRAERDRLAIWFGGVRVACKGLRDPAYDEAEVSRIMQRQEIVINVDIGVGAGAATVWTCDLTKEYVAINGDYRS